MFYLIKLHLLLKHSVHKGNHSDGFLPFELCCPHAKVCNSLAMRPGNDILANLLWDNFRIVMVGCSFSVQHYFQWKKQPALTFHNMYKAKFSILSISSSILLLFSVDQSNGWMIGWIHTHTHIEHRHTYIDRQTDTDTHMHTRLGM